jgi:hypothetical protein
MTPWMDNTEAVPWEFLKTSVKEKTFNAGCPIHPVLANRGPRQLCWWGGMGGRNTIAQPRRLCRCFQVEPGFSPASKSGRNPYRSAEARSEGEGEAADLIAFVVAIVFFSVFSPKIACQAQKPSKPLNNKEIHLAFLVRSNWLYFKQ